MPLTLHNDFLLFNKESALDPVIDTFSTHGTPISPADMFFFVVVVLDNFIKTLDLSALTPQSWSGHTPHEDFGAFQTFLV